MISDYSFEMLKCNGSKTEVIVISSRHMAKMIDCTSFAIGDVDVQPAVSVRNLGAIFDQHFTFTDHIASCVKSANFPIHKFGKIRVCLTTEATKMYEHALVTSRLDFFNALLYGQSVHPSFCQHFQIFLSPLLLG